MKSLALQRIQDYAALKSAAQFSLCLTPDPSGLQFKPSTPYGTIPDGSGLKFGQAKSKGSV